MIARVLVAADFGHHARFSHFPIHGLCASCAGAGDAEEDFEVVAEAVREVSWSPARQVTDGG